MYILLGYVFFGGRFGLSWIFGNSEDENEILNKEDDNIKERTTKTNDKKRKAKKALKCLDRMEPIVSDSYSEDNTRERNVIN